MRVVIMCLLKLLIGNTAFAAPQLWYDKTVPFKNIKKIVVLPIEGEYYPNAANDWKKKLEDKVKKIHFSFLEIERTIDPFIEENADYDYILNTEFASEEERGRAIQEKTAADAYLICKVRVNEEQTDWSPETECDVTISRYTTDSGGPDGYQRYDESSYDTTYTVEGQWVSLHRVELDYYMYDTNGNKIMLLKNKTQGYDEREDAQFRELFKEFAEELKDVCKHKGKW